MNIESKEIYDEMADYVHNSVLTGDISKWQIALEGWEDIPDPTKGGIIQGCIGDNEDPKEWRVEDDNLHLNSLPPDGNISTANWAATNHKKVNLSLYVVNALNSHMVGSIDELN